jgi:SAM-dependent methyltransferase
MADHGYALTNRNPAAAGRFTALSALFDPVTAAHLDRLGVRPGWRCWEVGAGGPSVPRLLAERVGPTGLVLATDIDTRWIGDPGPPVRVLRHDVARDDPPAEGFDLVHARLVLSHLTRRDQALAQLVRALRPGGVLLIEDFDVALQPMARLDPHHPEHHRANKIRAGFRDLLARRGVDLRYGRALPRLLAEHGLTDVAADAYQAIALPAVDALEIANVTQTGDQLVADGHATEQDIHAHLAALGAGVGLAVPPLVSAWGRKPDRR